MGSNIVSIFWIILIIGVLSDFKEDKPQLFSFLFFSVLIYLITYRDNRKLIPFIFIPIIMLLWANMHGGFILGVLVLIIYGISGVINREISKGYIIIIVLSIILSFFNPNRLNAIPFVVNLHSSIFPRDIIEYYSPIRYMKYSHTYLIPYWIIMFLFILNLKRIKISNGILLLPLSIISLMFIKYIPFFVLSVPLFGEFYSYRRSKWVIIPAISLFLFLTIAGINNRKSPDIFPSKASKFVENISGNLFNEYNIGGYLIWELYPKKRVFIDTRGLSEPLFLDYRSIMNGVDYNRLLNHYNVNIILIPACNYLSGNLYPIIPKIMNDNRWIPIYMDGKALVFIKSSKDNVKIINRYRIPEERVYDEIIIEARKGIKRNNRISGFYASLGYALIGKGEYKAGKRAYEKALRLNPEDKGLLRMIDILNSMGY
jgi:hypothetical protein